MAKINTYDSASDAEDVTLEDNLEEGDDTEEAEDGKSVTPLRALRRHCLWCCKGSTNEVKLCSAKRCPLWAFRFGRRPTLEDKAAIADVKLYPLELELRGGEFHEKGGTALKAIRRRCIDCSGGSLIGANGCTTSDCDLHPFRKGKNPNIIISEERRAELSARLAALQPRNGGQTSG
jgi:hypothetical protein